MNRAAISGRTVDVRETLHNIEQDLQCHTEHRPQAAAGVLYCLDDAGNALAQLRLHHQKQASPPAGELRRAALQHKGQLQVAAARPLHSFSNWSGAPGVQGPGPCCLQVLGLLQPLRSRPLLHWLPSRSLLPILQIMLGSDRPSLVQLLSGWSWCSVWRGALDPNCTTRVETTHGRPRQQLAWQQLC